MGGKNSGRGEEWRNLSFSGQTDTNAQTHRVSYRGGAHLPEFNEPFHSKFSIENHADIKKKG